MTESETLTPEELAAITGRKRAASQIEWLDKNGWAYVKNAANRPIVGRYYSRLKLAGVAPTENGVKSGWTPDLSVLDAR